MSDLKIDPYASVFNLIAVRAASMQKRSKMRAQCLKIPLCLSLVTEMGQSSQSSHIERPGHFHDHRLVLNCFLDACVA